MTATKTTWEDRTLPADFPEKAPRSIEDQVAQRDGEKCRMCQKDTEGKSMIVRVRDQRSPSDDPMLMSARACWGCAQQVKHMWAAAAAVEDRDELIREYRLAFHLLDLVYEQNCQHEGTTPLRAGGRR